MCLKSDNFPVFRKYLMPVAAVISRLDNAKAVLYGIAKTQLNRLHRLQIYAARVITVDSREVNSKMNLKNSVCCRFEQKPGIEFCYSRIRLWTTSPHSSWKTCWHFRSMFEIHDLKSRTRLVERKSNLKFRGDREFIVYAPKLWNKLPVSIRTCQNISSFKKQLKTHLF